MFDAIPFMVAVAGGPRSGKTSLLRSVAKHPASIEGPAGSVDFDGHGVPVRLVETDPEDVYGPAPDVFVFMIRGEEYPECALAPIVRQLRAAVAGGVPAVLGVHWKNGPRYDLDPGRRRLTSVLHREVPGWSGAIIDARHGYRGVHMLLGRVAAILRTAVPA